MSASQFSGLITNPTVNVQLNSATSPAPMGISPLLGAALGVTDGNSIYCDATKWVSGPATGPYSLNWTVSGVLSVANDIAPWAIVPSPMACRFVRCVCKTMPIGVNLLLTLSVSTNAGVSFVDVATVIGITESNHIGVNYLPITLGTSNIVKLNCTQVGSPGTEGSDLTVSLFGTSYAREQ